MTVVKDWWYVSYLNTVDLMLTQDLTFTMASATATGISPQYVLDPDYGIPSGEKIYANALNMRTSGNSPIYKYNLPSGTVVRAAFVNYQQFKIVDYRLPDSGYRPIRTNSALRFFPEVVADANTGTIVLSLPSSSGSGWIGQTFNVKKIDTSINSVFLSGIGGDRIDGQSTYEITHPFESVKVLSNGSGWYIL